MQSVVEEEQQTHCTMVGTTKVTNTLLKNITWVSVAAKFPYCSRNNIEKYEGIQKDTQKEIVFYALKKCREVLYLKSKTLKWHRKLGDPFV